MYKLSQSHHYTSNAIRPTYLSTLWHTYLSQNYYTRRAKERRQSTFPQIIYNRQELRVGDTTQAPPPTYRPPPLNIPHVKLIYSIHHYSQHSLSHPPYCPLFIDAEWWHQEMRTDILNSGEKWFYHHLNTAPSLKNPPLWRTEEGVRGVRTPPIGVWFKK